MKRLVYVVILVFLVGIVYWVYTGLNGSPVRKAQAEKDMKSYLKTTYPGRDLVLGEVHYSMNFGAYMAKVTSRSDSSISFELNWRRGGKVFYDEYVDKYAKDEVLSKKFADQITENLKSILKDKINGFRSAGSELYIKKGDYSGSDNYSNAMPEKVTVWVDMFGDRISQGEFVDRCVKARDLIAKEGYNIETYSFSYSTSFKGDVKGDGEQLYGLNLGSDLFNASAEQMLKSKILYENTGKGKMIVADLFYKGVITLFVSAIIGAGIFIALKERKSKSRESKGRA
ncbi:MAG: hypothetical protein Q8930_16255 [Bacillota bacterium]|nr:hypothetical protein [Bacillota bacterium]